MLGGFTATQHLLIGSEQAIQRKPFRSPRRTLLPGHGKPTSYPRSPEAREINYLAMLRHL